MALSLPTHHYLGNSEQNTNPAAEPQSMDQNLGGFPNKINDNITGCVNYRRGRAIVFMSLFLNDLWKLVK